MNFVIITFSSLKVIKYIQFGKLQTYFLYLINVDIYLI